MSVQDILAEVLGEHDFADFEDKLTESYDPIHYCVQYRESDYDFCCRLMEEFGISYCFEHSDGKHTMILADSKSSYSQIEGDPNIPFIPLGGDSQRDEEHIYDWIPGRNFRTGKFAINDYDFEKPSASLEAEKDAGSAYRAGALESYDYPGRYTEKDKGTKYSNIRLEAEQAADKRIECARRGRASLCRRPVHTERAPAWPAEQGIPCCPGEPPDYHRKLPVWRERASGRGLHRCLRRPVDRHSIQNAGAYFEAAYSRSADGQGRGAGRNRRRRIRSDHGRISLGSGTRHSRAVCALRRSCPDKTGAVFTLRALARR